MPIGGPAFSSVRKARALLKERAEELLNKYIKIVDQAAAAGDFETAQKGIQWLVDHIPSEDGERVFDISVDKIVQDSKTSGPAIQIGVVIGGMGQNALPESSTLKVIDVPAEVISKPDTDSNG
jgi:hypothetical protein